LFQQIADAGNIPIIGPLLQRYGQGFIGAAAVAIGSALLLSITVWWLLKVVRKRKASALVRKEELEEHE
jgi:putative Mn2+ efflux pump MntP